MGKSQYLTYYTSDSKGTSKDKWKSIKQELGLEDENNKAHDFD